MSNTTGQSTAIAIEWPSLNELINDLESLAARGHAAAEASEIKAETLVGPVVPVEKRKDEVCASPTQPDLAARMTSVRNGLTNALERIEASLARIRY